MSAMHLRCRPFACGNDCRREKENDERPTKGVVSEKNRKPTFPPVVSSRVFPRRGEGLGAKRTWSETHKKRMEATEGSENNSDLFDCAKRRLRFHKRGGQRRGKEGTGEEGSYTIIERKSGNLQIGGSIFRQPVCRIFIKDRARRTSTGKKKRERAMLKKGTTRSRKVACVVGSTEKRALSHARRPLPLTSKKEARTEVKREGDW